MNTHKPKQIFDVGRTLPPKHSHPPAYSTNKAVFGQPPKPLFADEAPPKKWKKILLWTVLAVVGLFLFIGTWDLVNISRASSKTFGSGNILSLLTPTSLKGQNGRVNVLIVGYSIDDPGHSGASLTDSILLLSLSTTRPTGYMLSIPRDLYVREPGFGYSKINAVYDDGGMSLLEKIVASDFNMPINYYALVDYAAVRDTVDALGGITVTIKSSDPRGIYDPSLDYTSLTCCALANYPNGPVKLNGKQALNLSRARGDDYRSYGFGQADFDRTEHQRQIFTAIKDKLNWTLVLNPLKNGKIFSSVGSNVKTNISLREVRPLFSLFNHVPSTRLQSESLRVLGGKNYLTDYNSYFAGDALIPAAGLDDYSQIDAAIAQLNQTN